jgi:beta-1,4-N-acetylglucosaminyltransferase
MLEDYFRGIEMKIFVTVGSSKFDLLFKKLDQILIENENHIVIGQIGNGKYLPKYFKKFFRFTNRISKYYKWADLVISHGGAGSIFDILENNKKAIVIPNKELISNHQTELIDIFNRLGYIRKGELDQLFNLIETTPNYRFKKYYMPENKIQNIIKKYIENMSA